VAVGSVDGFGSIIVNGIRFNIDAATLDLEDIGSLALGHVVRIDGTIDASGTTGTAAAVHAAQELQGTVSAVQPDATFTVLGQRVSVSGSTVYEGVTGVSALAVGDAVQVSGLPSQGGKVLATRIVKRAGSTGSLVTTGQITSVNSGAKVIQVGGLTVSYSASTAIEEPASTTLQVGAYVRVHGTLGTGGTLAATKIRRWQVPAPDLAKVAWSGVVSDYASIGSFKIGSLPVDASSAAITGGPSSAIGNGVRVELEGVMNAGVLKAAKLRIKHVPGTGGPVSFSVSGAIGAFTSASSFRVQGQPINAGGAGVVFVNGTAANLRNGQKVSVVGSQVVEGVLIAQTVTFE
jgi:hypothetical protein